MERGGSRPPPDRAQRRRDHRRRPRARARTAGRAARSLRRDTRAAPRVGSGTRRERRAVRGGVRRRGRPRARPRRRRLPGHPLDGVTIVEFGYFYAMPYGTALAAALGARVDQARGRVGRPDAPLVRTRTRVGQDLRREGEPLRRPVERRRPRDRAPADRPRRRLRHGLPLGGRRAQRTRLRGAVDSATRACSTSTLPATGPRGRTPSVRIYAQAAQAIGGSFGRQVGAWIRPERNVEHVGDRAAGGRRAAPRAHRRRRLERGPRRASVRSCSASTTSSAPARGSSCARA